MKVLVLDIGAIVVKHKDTEWLFGAPKNVDLILKEYGISPKAVFTTSMKAPAIGRLGPILHFKEEPLAMNGLSAKPIEKKHGTDYIIDDGQNQILFSERGDVSYKDVESYPLAIIKNRHPVSEMDSHDGCIITWPWSTQELEVVNKEVNVLSITEKVWSSMSDVPSNLKKIGETSLTLTQANQVARIANSAGQDGEEAWGIAISQFEKSHEVKDGKWVKKQEEKTKELLSKEDVNYREADNNQPCKNCLNYNDGMCKMVEGKIESEYTCDKWIGKQEKEIVTQEIQPSMEINKSITSKVKRFGDILIADLHTAYNNASDYYYRDGWMTGDERKAVGKAIGAALDALRASAPKEVMERIVESYPIYWDTQMKETIESEINHMLPKEVESGWKTVWKDDEGNYRWASISSVAVKDNQGETLTPEAMDWALGFAKLIGNKGPLRFRHVPGLDGGDCTYQKRVGDFLFESGRIFVDTPVGARMKELLETEDYQISLGLLYAPSDIENGVYKRAAIFERSMTKKPANYFTAMIGKETEMKVLNEEQLKEVAQDIGLDLTEIKTMYERAMAAGIFGQGQFKEMALKELGAGVVTGDSEEQEEYTREQMKEILESLSVSEFKELSQLITEVKADSSDEENMDEEEEDDEVEVEVEVPLKKKKKEDTIEQLLIAQTKALQELALSINSTRGETKKAVADLIGGLPRKQAQRFITQKKEGVTPETDEAVMTQLKQIQDELNRMSTTKFGGFSSVYDQFTSDKLNK